MNGDEAFEAEALVHLDFVYAVARRLMPTKAEAEDLVQETYLRALGGWRRQRPQDVRPWLATICRNAARDAWRRQGARPREVWDEEHLADMTSPLDTAEQAISNLEVAALHRALNQLPLPTREAIGLVDLAGLTHEEASRVLGVPRGTVLSRVHRGRKALTALIRDEVADHEARP